MVSAPAFSVTTSGRIDVPDAAIEKIFLRFLPHGPP
jgi:hypothetical protein